jgi:excisionase family DNA binding protein
MLCTVKEFYAVSHKVGEVHVASRAPRGVDSLAWIAPVYGREARVSEERMLTVEEVAERVRAHPQTVRAGLRSGKLKGHMPGGKRLGYRIPESEVERFLRGNLEPPTP